MSVHHLGEKICQQWWLVSSRHLPQGVWPSIQVGRSLLPPPSPQPVLGFCAKTSLISDLLICMRSFWVLGIEPSCPALPYSVLQAPMLGSSWGTCFQKPCSARPRGDACSSCAPILKCFGV